MAKRIQNFINFNSEKEEPIKTVKKVNIAKKPKRNEVSKNRGVKRDAPVEKYQPNNKEHKEKEPNNSKFIIAFFIILIIIGIGVGCLFSPTFNLTGIVVKDGDNITKEEILNSFYLPMGTNIFKIEYENIEKSVKKLPYIQTASANIKLPNEMEIDYVERIPFALLKYLESFLVMDKYGYILEITKENKFKSLPIIYNIKFDTYEIGSKLEDTAKIKYDNVVYLIEHANQNNFKYSISEINYESISNVKMWVKGLEVEIIYGEIDRNIIGDKLNYISEILTRINGKQGRVDVSSSDYLENTVFTERL